MGAPAPRVLVVSNRLPLTVRATSDSVEFAAASGGLATGLRPWQAKGAGCWIGWPGDVSQFTPEQRGILDRARREQSIVPVYLSRSHIDRHYHGSANRVLWPLFHYLIQVAVPSRGEVDSYQGFKRQVEEMVGLINGAGNSSRRPRSRDR